MSKQKTLRREKALERLHRQLKEGVKSKNLKENSKTSLKFLGIGVRNDLRHKSTRLILRPARTGSSPRRTISTSGSSGI